MKKIELHLHLDGSLNLDYAKKLLGKECKNEMCSGNSKNLKDYLDKFSLPIKLLQDADTIETFSYLLGKELVQEDVIYAEVRFCPLFHIEKISVDEVIEAVIKGFKRVKDIKINLIFCMMRNFSFEKNLEIINLTEKYLGNYVVGIDLAGDEANFKTKDFTELFKIIREKKIPFTIHAGEADGAASVMTAIEFGAKRIGHGVRSIENNDVIKKLKENNIVLEICPTSNINTHLYNSIKDNPIDKLRKLGIKVTVNTDNRTVSNTSLNKEYQLLKDNFGYNDDDFLEFNLNAIEAAFISEEEKEALRNKLLKK